MTGSMLRALRKRYEGGVTQKVAAKVLGITTNSLARLERGEVNITTPIARLARLLLGGERPADILDEIDDS